MPRRNRRGRRNFPPPAPAVPEVKDLSYHQMAVSLVERGLAGPVILGPRPPARARAERQPA